VHLWTDGDKMSIGSTVEKQASYDSHADNCSSSTPAHHHLIHVVTAAARVESLQIVADDHLGPSGGRHLNGIRRRSYSASGLRPVSPIRSPTRSVTQFLSPDYGSTPPVRRRPATHRRRVERRGQDGNSGSATSDVTMETDYYSGSATKDVKMETYYYSGSATKDGSGATIKRSSSATLTTRQ